MNIRFIRPLINLIETYPGVQVRSPAEVQLQYAGVSDISNLQVAPLELNTPFGNALSYIGTPRPTTTANIIDRNKSTRQANFIFFIRKNHGVFSEFNEEMYDFISDFELWIEELNFLAEPEYDLSKPLAKNKIYRFGNPDYNEYLWADNGMFMGINDNPFSIDYQIQMHIQYQLKYQKISDTEKFLNGGF